MNLKNSGDSTGFEPMIISSFDMDNDDNDIVITKFKEYCVGQRNETLERYNFIMRVQQEG